MGAAVSFSAALELSFAALVLWQFETSEWSSIFLRASLACLLLSIGFLVTPVINSRCFIYEPRSIPFVMRRTLRESLPSLSLPAIEALEDLRCGCPAESIPDELWAELNKSNIVADTSLGRSGMRSDIAPFITWWLGKRRRKLGVVGRTAKVEATVPILAATAQTTSATHHVPEPLKNGSTPRTPTSPAPGVRRPR